MDCITGCDDCFIFLTEHNPTGTKALVAQFTIVFEESESGIDMVLRWERTEVRAAIQAE